MVSLIAVCVIPIPSITEKEKGPGVVPKTAVRINIPLLSPLQSGGIIFIRTLSIASIPESFGKPIIFIEALFFFKLIVLAPELEMAFFRQTKEVPKSTRTGLVAVIFKFFA